MIELINYFKSNDILNIFCDASIMQKSNRQFSGCYGAIAVCNDTIIEKSYCICTNTTNNDSELKAIRLGLRLALKYRNQYRVINLFSDSQISIFGIRDRIFNWKLANGKIIGNDNNYIKNQFLFIELMNVIVDNNLFINIYHQKGHVNLNNLVHLREAAHVFQCSNFIRDIVSYDFIRYISIYNNYVDNESRSILKQSRSYLYDRNYNYCDPIYFYPNDNYNTKVFNYKTIQANNKKYMEEINYEKGQC